MLHQTELKLDLCYLRQPPPVEVVSELAAELGQINHYPSGDYSGLIEDLADYTGVAPENIVPGNGLDEVIDSITRIWGENVLIPVPTFSQFELAASRRGSQIHHCQCLLPDPLLETRSYRLRYSEMELTKASLVWICSPNNPTGTIIPRQDIVHVLEHTNAMVAVDECYFEFTGQTIVDLVATHSNLVVLRSFSKSFGLAGLRLGFAISQARNIQMLDRNRQIFNVNRMAEAAGRIVLRYEHLYRRIWDQIAQTREQTWAALKQASLTVHPSSANFLLLEFANAHEAERNWKKLLRKGIRTFAGSSEEFIGLGGEFLRINIGTPEEMVRVTETLCS